METLTFLFTSSFYPPYHLGGDAVHVKYVADELAKRGHEVHVLHSLDAYRVKRPPKGYAVESESVRTHRIETPLSLSAYWAYVQGRSHAVTKRFREILRETTPDVVHHHNVSLLGYNILARQGNYVNLHTAHDYWLFCQQSNLLKFGRALCIEKNCLACSLVTARPRQIWRRDPIFKRAVQELDCIIAPSRFMLETLRRNLPDVNMRHIANFAPRAEAHVQSRQETKSPHLMYMGALEHRKGVILLLEEYAKSALREIVPLRVVGTGPLESKIAEFTRSKKLEAHVSMLGSLPSPAARQELLNSVALILPSIWYENAPLVALEAMSMGTPPIGSDLGGLPEIVEPVNPRLIFSWNESKGLERSLRFALSCQRDLRESARNAFNSLFCPERYVSSYVDLIVTCSRQKKTRTTNRSLDR